MNITTDKTSDTFKSFNICLEVTSLAESKKLYAFFNYCPIAEAFPGDDSLIRDIIEEKTDGDVCEATSCVEHAAIEGHIEQSV